MNQAYELYFTDRPSRHFQTSAVCCIVTVLAIKNRYCLLFSIPCFTLVLTISLDGLQVIQGINRVGRSHQVSLIPEILIKYTFFVELFRLKMLCQQKSLCCEINIHLL